MSGGEVTGPSGHRAIGPSGERTLAAIDRSTETIVNRIEHRVDRLELAFRKHLQA
jgi:hypothetical protein